MVMMNVNLNDFQAWAIQNPEAGLSKALLPLISVVEGLLATKATYLPTKRQKFGPNFCCAGQVVLGDFETLKVALSSPQARTWRLGTSVLDAHLSPNQDVGGRNVFCCLSLMRVQVAAVPTMRHSGNACSIICSMILPHNVNAIASPKDCSKR